mmetsp:Transcript_28000/g.78307  ORF Transcript_28000/g.78307 Transcript_28000/m.78307 type:complete len:225 (+) Transcript_28000:1046-1720(+)
MRVTITSRVCPMRWHRSMACSSTCGFHHGSHSTTWFAATRFRPTEAAFRLMIMTVTWGSSRKSATALSRAAMDMEPSRRRNLYFCSFMGTSRMSSMEVHCVKITTFSGADRALARLTGGGGRGFSAAAIAMSEPRLKALGPGPAFFTGTLFLRSARSSVMIWFTLAEATHGSGSVCSAASASSTLLCSAASVNRSFGASSVLQAGHGWRNGSGDSGGPTCWWMH